MRGRGPAMSVAVAGAPGVVVLALGGYNGQGPLAARLGVALPHLEPSPWCCSAKAVAP